MNKDEILAVAQRLDAICVASCGCWTKTPDWRYHGLSCRYRITQEAVKALRELALESSSAETSVRCTCKDFDGADQFCVAHKYTPPANREAAP